MSFILFIKLKQPHRFDFKFSEDILSNLTISFVLTADLISGSGQFRSRPKLKHKKHSQQNGQAKNLRKSTHIYRNCFKLRSRAFIKSTLYLRPGISSVCSLYYTSLLLTIDFEKLASFDLKQSLAKIGTSNLLQKYN